MLVQYFKLFTAPTRLRRSIKSELQFANYLLSPLIQFKLLTALTYSISQTMGILIFLAAGCIPMGQKGEANMRTNKHRCQQS